MVFVDFGFVDFRFVDFRFMNFRFVDFGLVLLVPESRFRVVFIVLIFAIFTISGFETLLR